ncbi:MAG TPA: YceI family protein [Caulobacteraceae bacterium]|jgi:polyisoprenoid-binding protein YceI
MTRSRAAVFAALALTLPLLAAAAPPTDIPRGHYVLDPRHSTLIARVRHMGVSLYTIRFDTLSASFDYDPARPEATRLEASVDPASMDVNNPDTTAEFTREFLNVAKFPHATFVSTHAQPGPAPGHGTLTGDLTLMGVTRPVTFDVTLVGEGHEVMPVPLGRRAAGFEATTTIKRSDFGSTFLGNLVGDDVTLQIEAEFEEHR